MPSGSYATTLRECLRPTLRHISTLSKGPRVSSQPDICDYQTSPRLLLDATQHEGFWIARTVTPAMKSPHSKYSPIPVGAVMDSDGYLSMPISTIKHNNLNGYERISTVDRITEKDPHHQLHHKQFTYRPKEKERRWSRDQWKKEEERNVLRKLSCNTQKKIVNPSSFLPVIFSILGFHVKISVFICLPIGILYHFRQVSLSLVVWDRPFD